MRICGRGGVFLPGERFEGWFKSLLEPQGPAEGAGSAEAFRSRAVGAGKSLITYICFYGNVWELRRGGEREVYTARSQWPPPRLLRGHRPRRPGPLSAAGAVKGSERREQDGATGEGSGLYAPRFCAAKENNPVKCELIGSGNWRVALPPVSWWAGGIRGLSAAAEAIRPASRVGVHAGPLR